MILFGKAQIICGIVPNLIGFYLFLEAIRYFALTVKMFKLSGLNKNRYRNYDCAWCKILKLWC